MVVMTVLADIIGVAKRLKYPREVSLFASATFSTLLSRSEGGRTPFVSAILVRMAVASFVRDLEISHLGDSGRNVQVKRRKTRGETDIILIILHEARSQPKEKGYPMMAVLTDKREEHLAQPPCEAGVADDIAPAGNVTLSWILYFIILIKFDLFLTSDISHKMLRGDWNKGSMPNVANT